MSFPITPGEVYTLNNLVSKLFKDVGLGDLLNLQTISSAAGAGGAATEVMTFTGLAAADTIIGLTQTTPGANNLAVVSWGTQIADAVTIRWTANPGAGAIVRLSVIKAPV